VFKGVLYVIGGAPLTNDIWVGNLTVTSDYENTPIGDVPSSGFTMEWKQRVPYMSDTNPFSPRSGHCLTTQVRRNDYNSTEDLGYTDRMFLIGGFGSWPLGDDRYDGERSRNDIYETVDGKNWTKLEAPLDSQNQQPLSMPWAARAWLGCATFHDPADRSVDVSAAARFAVETDELDANEILNPRMYIFGGGYIGTKGNNVVRKMEAYVDAWWSRDGRDWKRVHYKERYSEALYSTQEWALTSVEDVPINIGKWGFTVLNFFKQEDLDGDGIISDSNKYRLGGSDGQHVGKCEPDTNAVCPDQDPSCTTDESGVKICEYACTATATGEDVVCRAEICTGEGEELICQPGLGPGFDFAGNMHFELVNPDAGAADKELYTALGGYLSKEDLKNRNPEALFWRRNNQDEAKIPTLVFVAGDTVDSGSLVNDVFKSQPGLLCEIEGVTCSENGICGPGTMGCICTSRQYIGEYCEQLNANYVAAGMMLRPLLLMQLMVVGAAVLSLV
jgi:hypothetical protein